MLNCQRVTADFISFIREGSVEIEVFAKRRIPLKAIPSPPLRVGEPVDIHHRFNKEGDDMMSAHVNQTGGSAPMPPQVQHAPTHTFNIYRTNNLRLHADVYKLIVLVFLC